MKTNFTTITNTKPYALYGCGAICSENQWKLEIRIGQFIPTQNISIGDQIDVTGRIRANTDKNGRERIHLEVQKMSDIALVNGGTKLTHRQMVRAMRTPQRGRTN